MRKTIKQILVVSAFAITASCTENKKARTFGGTAKLELPVGQKLINVTWKESNLWHLTRPMVATDTAATYTFHEQSSLGVWEGTYIIIEKK